MARRPEYVLTKDFAGMPARSHVTPVRPRYLNRYSLQELEEQLGIKFDLETLVQIKSSYDPTTYRLVESSFMICYTALGYQLIPTSSIEVK